VKRTVAFLTLTLIVVAIGCRKAPQPKKVSLRQGTEVPLLLAANLEAGQSRKGTVVPFLVAQDVRGEDGTPVIAKGALAYGQVVWSRSEGTLSAMMNQPARLDVRLDYVLARDGQKVLLEAEPGKGDSPYEFTRANTGKLADLRTFEQAWSDPDKQKAMTLLMQLIERSKRSDLANDPQTAEVLDQLSKDLGLSYGQLDSNSKERVSSLLGSVGNGEISVDRMARAALPEVAALLELTRVTGFIGRQIGGALKGRTIRAYVGTPVAAFVRADQTVTVPSEEAG